MVHPVVFKGAGQLFAVIAGAIVVFLLGNCYVAPLANVLFGRPDSHVPLDFCTHHLF